jgi:hypothetical protein
VCFSFAALGAAKHGAKKPKMTWVAACALLTNVALFVVYWPVKARVVARRFRGYRIPSNGGGQYNWIVMHRRWQIFETQVHKADNVDVVNQQRKVITAQSLMVAT